MRRDCLYNYQSGCQGNCIKAKTFPHLLMPPMEAKHEWNKSVAIRNTNGMGGIPSGEGLYCPCLHYKGAEQK